MSLNNVAMEIAIANIIRRRDRETEKNTVDNIVAQTLD